MKPLFNESLGNNFSRVSPNVLAQNYIKKLHVSQDKIISLTIYVSGFSVCAHACAHTHPPTCTHAHTHNTHEIHSYVVNNTKFVTENVNFGYFVHSGTKSRYVFWNAVNVLS